MDICLCNYALRYAQLIKSRKGTVLRLPSDMTIVIDGNFSWYTLPTPGLYNIPMLSMWLSCISSFTQCERRKSIRPTIQCFLGHGWWPLVINSVSQHFQGFSLVPEGYSGLFQILVASVFSFDLGIPLSVWMYNVSALGFSEIKQDI